MPQPNVAPRFDVDAFECPFVNCHAFAKQEWLQVSRYIPYAAFIGNLQNYHFSACHRCNRVALWKDEVLVFPTTIPAPTPQKDMPPDILIDYEEARKVLPYSPRASAALLRLCLQKICVELGEPGKNINTDIGTLVSKGLSVHIQQALDIVRVVGNEQVHPGLLDIRDDPEIAGMLFTLVNLIVDDRISKPKAVEEMYGKLPNDKLEGIQNRDKAKS